MKAILESSKSSCIDNEYLVKTETTNEELIEFYEALIVIDRFKSQALQVAGIDMQSADLTMIDYDIKSGVIFITIRQGSCG